MKSLLKSTPILYGEDAIEFLKELERVNRGKLTPEEIELKKKIDSLERVVLF